MTESTPSLGVELHALVSLIDRAATRVLGSDGETTYRRYVALLGIAQLDGPTQHELADHLGLSDPAVSRMLSNLADAGLVTASADPLHRRRRTVRLTPEGAAVEQRIGRRLDAAMEEMLVEVGLDAAAFTEQVARLRRGFRTWLDTPRSRDVQRGFAHPDLEQAVP